jgi:hypothetical protein
MKILKAYKANVKNILQHKKLYGEHHGKLYEQTQHEKLHEKQ